MRIGSIRIRSRYVEIGLVGLAIVAAIYLGRLVDAQGVMLLYLAVGVGAALLMLVRPLWGLLIFAATIPAENLIVVEGGITGTRLLGMAVFAAWAINKLLRGTPWKRVLSSRYFWMAGAFVTLAWASSLWAEHPVVVRAAVPTLFQLFALGVLLTDLTGSWKRSDLLVKALLIGAGIAAAVTLHRYFFWGLKRSGVGGPNATAVMLVTLLPFGFYLLRGDSRLFWRMFGLAYIGAALLAIVLTFSRMNMLLLPPLMLALLWDTIRSRGGRVWLLGLTAVGLVVGLRYVPWDELEERAATITPYLEDTFGAGDSFDDTPSGRGYHLRVGLAIWGDHPLLGAGLRNYGYLFRDQYQFTVPGAPKFYGSARSPHSSYVGIAADLGIVGLLLWCGLLFAVGVRNVVRAWLWTRGREPPSRHFLVQAVTYALFLHVFAYGLYMPSHETKIFWTLLGMSVVVYRLARVNRPARAAPAVPWPQGFVDGRSAPVEDRKVEARVGSGGRYLAPLRQPD